jgi:uncharacterized membrane protein YfcA
MLLPAFLFGLLVGLSLGLTGGGGTLFAVPLLVYGLGLQAKEAVMISLATVGATSLLGFRRRWESGHVDVSTGILFAVAGMVGAPAGTWIASWIPDTVLLLAFAVLMTVISVRMWPRSSPVEPAAGEVDATDSPAMSCQRSPGGRLLLTSRCLILLLVAGMLTGMLAGLFGVGGGFAIVPALVMLTGIPLHHAIGTSLMIVAMISASGLVTHLLAGQTIPIQLTSLFLTGSIAGLVSGEQLSHRLSTASLQKLLAVAILLVAIFIVFRQLQS